MATAIRPIGHEDRLSLVEHLDELRRRLVICGLTLAVAFGVAAWQNHALLEIVNRPLERTTVSATKHSHGPLGSAQRSQRALRRALESGGVAFASSPARRRCAAVPPTKPRCAGRSSPTRPPSGHCPRSHRDDSRSRSASASRSAPR